MTVQDASMVGGSFQVVVMRVWTMVVVAVLVVPSASLHAWGMDVHRALTDRAIDALPAQLSSFLAADRAFVIEHAVDPDLWRVVDLRGQLGTEDPNHYFNLDTLGEPRPFSAVPRDRRAFVTKYGSRRAEDAGRLPWRVAEMHAALVRAFRDVGPSADGFRATNVRFLSAVLSHYVADAHVPFHATGNHDGQLTNQRGIHARFETELALRHLNSVTRARGGAASSRPIVDVVFDVLVESEALVAPVLEADRAAAGPRRTYNAAYFSAFSRTAGSIVTRRMNDTVRRIAQVIESAWIEAGRPALRAS